MLGLHVLGEHRRVLRPASVDTRCRLHDEALQTRGSLAGSKELHGADDVDFFHRASATGLLGGRNDPHVHDRIDLRISHDLGDDRIADISSNEVSSGYRHHRGDDIDADHPIDVGLSSENLGDATSEVAGYARHQNNATHGAPSQQAPPGRRANRYFLLRRWTRVRRSSLRCFFLAIRLRRFLMTEPINESSRWLVAADSPLSTTSYSRCEREPIAERGCSGDRSGRQRFAPRWV